MQSQLTKLAKGLPAANKPATPKDVTEAAPTRLKPGRKVVFTPERLKNERARLGFTQDQMATLLGVSSLSIWKWESGGAIPREKRVPEILSRMAMGKREATSLLEKS